MTDQYTKSGRLTAGDIEHLGAMALGTTLVLFGVGRRSLAGLLMAVAGGALVYRGAQGYKRLYDTLGINMPPKPAHLPPSAIKVEKTIHIERRPEELYSWWRNLENLPQAMGHLKSVTEQSNGRSHWVAKAPMGTTVEWEAEVIRDVPGELIAWQSLEGSDVDNAGAVRFVPSGEGTDLCVTVRYLPPGNQAGAMVARLLGEDPDMQMQEDLTKFKHLAEKGYLA